jgi:hypothetical protein
MVKRFFLISVFFMMGAFLVYASSPKGSTATITSVKGAYAQVDLNGTGDFEDCQKGMVVNKKSVIMTGLKSQVVLTYGKHGKLKVGEMSYVELYKIFYTPKKINCKANLKVGEVEVKVDPNLVEVDFSVSTPTSTASVRGTYEKVSYYPGFGTHVKVFKGKVFAKAKKGTGFHVKEGESTKVSEEQTQPTPTYQTTYSDYKTDYVDEGRTDEETQAITEVSAPTSSSPEEIQTQTNQAEQAVGSTSVTIRGNIEGDGVTVGSGNLSVDW